MRAVARVLARGPRRAPFAPTLAPSAALAPKFLGFARGFSSETGTLGKVLEACDKYLKQRAQEVQLELQEGQIEKDSAEYTEKEQYVSALGQQISATSTWDEYGLDELDRVELLLEVEFAFDTLLPDEVADNLKSVPEVVQYL